MSHPDKTIMTMGTGIFNINHKHGDYIYPRAKGVQELEQYISQLPVNRFRRSMGL